MSVFPVRVYYEDTDHGGVVYHANYLKFMERARSELMREHGWELDAVEESFAVLFAVAHIDMHFERPARFNDILQVHSKISLLKGARMVFEQTIYRQQERLIKAQITIVSMDRTGRARRIPPAITESFNLS